MTFSSTLTIDNTGVNIIIGLRTAAKIARTGNITPVELTVDMKHGTLSYVLPQRMKVNIVLVDARGVAVMRLSPRKTRVSTWCGPIGKTWSGEFITRNSRPESQSA